MGESGRHSISAKGVNHICRADFITHGIKVQTESFSDLCNLPDGPFQFFHLVGHESSPLSHFFYHTSVAVQGCGIYRLMIQPMKKGGVLYLQRKKLSSSGKLS